MKRFFLIISLFISVSILANNNDVIYNLVVANNNLSDRIEVLEKDRRAVFYSEFVKVNSPEGLTELVYRNFGQEEGAKVLTDINTFWVASCAYSNSNIKGEDWYTFFDGNADVGDFYWNDCKNISGYNNCIAQMKLSIESYVTDNIIPNMATGAGAGAGVGAIVDLITGGGGMGMTYGTAIGTMAGAGFTIYKAYSMYGNGQNQCYAKFCKGQDIGPGNPWDKNDDKYIDFSNSGFVKIKLKDRNNGR